MGSLVLLDLMGGVALLLWGLHMVHSGILRAFGPDLRLLLAKALRNRFTAVAAGLGLTALLQSSTATALITSSFTSEGLVSLVPALAIMLGANVGTTLIVQILSFNIAAVAPVLFIIGLVAFRSGPRSHVKDIGLDEREGQRAMEIVSFSINLEHIGDIIDKNLSELATKKIKRRFQFSAEGAEELSAFHKRTMDSLRIAFGVFMSGDVSEARKLLAEKAALRSAELAATERHLDRLREGRPETIETTSLHLDVLRDLRRIHSHICSLAYPVLDAAGELAAYRACRKRSAGAACAGPRAWMISDPASSRRCRGSSRSA